MSSQASRKQRDIRTIVIEPFKQIKFGIYVISMTLVFVVFTSLMFLWAFREQYQHVMNIFNVAEMGAQMELITNDIFARNIKIIGSFFVLFTLLEFWIVFKLTHRYYGPLVSIERFVEEMTVGDYSKRVIIRRHDELHRLTGKLNAMAEALEHR